MSKRVTPEKLRENLERILSLCKEDDDGTARMRIAVLVGELFGGPGFIPSRRLTDEELDILYNQGKGLSYPFDKEDKCEGKDPSIPEGELTVAMLTEIKNRAKERIAKEAEREQCCQDICEHCYRGAKPKRKPNGLWVHVGNVSYCRAERIRERAFKEQR